MNDKIKDKKVKFNSNKNNPSEPTSYIIYLNYYDFDIRYDILCHLIKDIQISSQLIKFIKKHQISDLIFIKGNNTYSVDSRFYFSYRNIIDFYVKVLDSIETDYFTKISYFIYKTKPSSKEFMVNITLFYINETSSRLSVEIILFNNATLNPKILNIIYSEFNFNFLYLSQAIKSNKLQTFSFCSSIIKNEFFVLTQIFQNIKLIEYIINGHFKKETQEDDNENNTNKDNENDNNSSINSDSVISSSEKDKKNSVIHVNENYTVILKKKKDINDYINVNKISFKVHLIKIREDNMIIQYKVLMNGVEIETKNDNTIYNIITIYVRKLTTNSSFIYFKYIWDIDIDEKIVLSIKSCFHKCMHNIEKLSKTAKHC